MRRYSLNPTGIGPFALAPQSSGSALQQSASAQLRSRQAAAAQSSSSAGAGRRRQTLTLSDLEDSAPFEHLKSIDKPPRSTGRTDSVGTDAAAGAATLPPTSRVSFHAADRDDFRRATPQPMTSLVPEKRDVMRTSPEPTYTWQPTATPLPETRADVWRATHEPAYTRQLMTSLLPEQNDVRRTSPEPAYARQPMTSSWPEKADVWRTTPEAVTSSGRAYADVKRSAQEPPASSTRAYVDVRPSTQGTATPSACMYAGPAPAPNNGTFCLACPVVSSRWCSARVQLSSGISECGGNRVSPLQLLFPPFD